MVDPLNERRDQPEHSLEQIRELSSRGEVGYGSRRAEWDRENLGYGHDELCRCIESLEPGDFQHSVRYSNRRFWMDVYRIRWRADAGPIDPLYLKLHLNRDMIFVTLDSIHRDR